MIRLLKEEKWLKRFSFAVSNVKRLAGGEGRGCACFGFLGVVCIALWQVISLVVGSAILTAFPCTFSLILGLMVRARAAYTDNFIA